MRTATLQAEAPAELTTQMNTLADYDHFLRMCHTWSFVARRCITMAWRSESCLKIRLLSKCKLARRVAAAISSLNWSEVLQKSLAHGVEISGLRADMEALGLRILPFDATDAELAARLGSPGSGLSLADRACLALGFRHGVPV